MKKGDILLINYKFDPIAYLIKLVTKSKWNHVAWALNEFMLIEVTGKGIKINPISKYLHSPLYNLKLIRLKDLSKSKIKKVSKRLLAQRGKIHYWKFFLSYFLVGFGLKPLVKNCSNFIFFEMRKEGYSIGKRNQKFINPEDFNSYKYATDITEEIPRGV